MTRCLRAACIVAAVGLAVTGCAGASSTAKGRRTMSTSQDVAREILNVGDGVYFDEKTVSFPSLVARLADTDFEGVAVSSPASVPTGSRATLPVLLAMQRRGLQAWEVNRDNNTVVFAADRATGLVRTGPVFRDAKAEDFSSPPPGARPNRPDEASAEAIVTGVTKFDARDILDLPWGPGRWSIGILLFDQASNTVDVDLEGEGPPPAPRAAAASPRPAAATTKAPPAGMATYAGPPRAALPEGSPAGAIAVDPAPGEASRLTVHGSFRVTASAAHLAPGAGKIVETDGSERSVAAVVPVTIAIVGLDAPRPMLKPLAVPVYGDAAARPGDLLEGRFSVDALAPPVFGLPAGRYAAWLFVDGRVFGPAVFDYAGAP